MSPIPARLGLVTLGVADLARSIAFYEALGWERAASSMDEISWFHTADTNLGLFPREELAADVGVPDEPRQRYAGFTLAINVETEDEVGAALQAAVDAGATLVKPATRAGGAACRATSPTPTGSCGRSRGTRPSRSTPTAACTSLSRACRAAS